ncbi:MAG: hypothetical protein IPH86_15030 [bacterium]|nr:hypothetical protein [bacterium]
MSAGEDHSLGLKADGSIVAWGSNAYGQCDVPSPNAGFVAVSAGGGYSLGLKANGTVAAWGYNVEGQCDVPFPNFGFLAIAAGYGSSLGIRTETWYPSRTIPSASRIRSPTLRVPMPSRRSLRTPSIPPQPCRSTFSAQAACRSPFTT